MTTTQTGPVRDRKIPELMSMVEAAEALGVSKQRVHAMIHAGQLPAARVGTSWAIRRAVVEALEIPTS
jgi:excisionase family DNA binding protein